ESLAIISVHQTWCVAKPSSSISSLTDNIEYSCSYYMDNEDCNEIKEGNPCFNPNSILHHASFAMNAYYQKQGRHYWNCDFKNSGLITITNPSNCDHSCCIYNGGDTFVDFDLSGKWCVAKSTASDEMLQANIDWACNQVDCSLIKAGGNCFEPNTLLNHASVAMNIYYQKIGKVDLSCDFNGTGLVVIKDPSYDTCKYQHLN
ncbi:hypothetical protein UlMin_018878, partial [Ulmus minor]